MKFKGIYILLNLIRTQFVTLLYIENYICSYEIYTTDEKEK